MKSFGEYRQELAEAKATYCGRCGTTHVPPSQGGTCPALKKEEAEQIDELSQDTLRSYVHKVAADSMKHPMDPSKRSAEKRNKSVMGFAKAIEKGTKGQDTKFFKEDDLSEAAPGENLPGRATHLTNKDVRHPTYGIIPGSTTLRHLGADHYEVRAGKAKGKTIRLGREHVQKLSEEVELDEDFTKMDTPTLKKWIATRERNAMAGNLSKKRGDQYDQAQAEMKKRKANEEAKLDESDLHTQFAAFAAARGGKVSTSADRKKTTAELIAKREKEAASRPKPEPQPYKEKYPLGGRDEKSGRSYSE